MKLLSEKGLFSRLVAILLIAALLLPALSPPLAAEAGTPEKGRIQPALAKALDANPNGRVKIIVRGDVTKGNLGAELDKRGAKGKKTFSLTKAYAAEMPASQVRELAKHQDVRWISIDAPMVTTSLQAAPPTESSKKAAATTATATPTAISAVVATATTTATASTSSTAVATTSATVTATVAATATPTVIVTAAATATPTAVPTVTAAPTPMSRTMAPSVTSTNATPTAAPTASTSTMMSGTSTSPSAWGAILATDYPKTVRALDLWNASVPITGKGVTVAVVDSGINAGLSDFGSGGMGGRSRVLAAQQFIGSSTATSAGADTYGHGTHVAGIIASNGNASRGKYIGIAPQANLLNIRVNDAKGMAYTSNVIDALEWVVKNRDAYNIRVVNLSLVSSIPESYRTNPLDAAVEMAWLSGITVVVSAGNNGVNTMLYAPANDPLVITVGATDTNGTPEITDDVLPSWSSYGTTQDGFSKPDVVAPGRRIISNIASAGEALAQQFPDRIVDRSWMRLSGTSMAAPMVSGIAALAFQAHPTWTPDQFKYAIMATARPLAAQGSGMGEVDASAVVAMSSPGYANRNVQLSLPVAAAVANMSQNSASWDSASWDSASWDSASWDSASWDSSTFD